MQLHSHWFWCFFRVHLWAANNSLKATRIIVFLNLNEQKSFLKVATWKVERGNLKWKGHYLTTQTSLSGQIDTSFYCISYKISRALVLVCLNIQQMRKWAFIGTKKNCGQYKKIAKEHKSPLILAVCLNGWLLHEWSNWQHCRYHPTINQRASMMPNEANKQCAWWEVVGIEWNPYSAIAMRWLWYFDRNDALYVITHHKLHLFNILHSIRFMYLAFGVFP